MPNVAAIARLMTYTDFNDWPGQPAGQVSFSAVLKAELLDGRQIVLLDDRGWNSSPLLVGGGRPSNPWSYETQENVEETARTVVGPDEPADGESHDEAARMHWSFLAAALEANGVATSGDELQSLPHDVVLSDRLLRRIHRQPRP